MIGLLPFVFSYKAELKRFPLLSVHLLAVVPKDHVLAKLKGLIPTDVMRQHVQLVLTDRSALTEGRDYGVLSPQTWRLCGSWNQACHVVGRRRLGKHAEASRRRRHPKRTVKGDPSFRISESECRADHGSGRFAERSLGPATQWMMKHLVESSQGSSS